MRQLVTRSILLAAILSTPVFAQPTTQPMENVPAAPQTVPVKSVVLFSSGVGYFQHAGSVKGDGNTELRFKTNQINDILKSLVLQDMDGGKVSTVQYPSQDPVEKTLKSFQVDITANPPLADLLNQLRGAKVSITHMGSEKYNGVILGVEQRQVPGGKQENPLTTWIVNVIDGASIRQIDLNNINEVKLDDLTLQSELDQALKALAKARDTDKKSVVINFTGAGERRIMLGYVVESPIWKTSYRLVIADKDTQLQGWAIVENQTDNDWENVQLSLVSGRPISFAMNLYQPLYITRPVVEMELYQSLRPQTYDEGMGVPAATMPQAAAEAKALTAPRVRRNIAGGFGGGGGAGVSGVMLEDVKDGNAEVMNITSSIQSVASAAKLGELFQYTVGNVSLPRQKSAMIPIVTDKVEIEKLSIYNQSVLSKHPLNGAMVTNSTDKHLLQGPITVFEANSYAGDAKIDNVPPGQKRLLSYGIDLQVLVQPKTDSASDLITGKIVKGVLHLTRKITQTQSYDIENKSDHEKTVVIENPIVQNWKLVNTPEPMEKTDNLYRFKLPMKKSEKHTFKVSQESVQGETIAILNMNVDTLINYSRVGAIPQEVKNAIIEAAKRRQSMVDIEVQISDRQKQIAAISAEQSRIRENMKTVERNSQYYNRLQTKLNDQETDIEKHQTESDSLKKQLEKARADYETYLNGLNIG